MAERIPGSRAVALAVARCRPRLVATYGRDPRTPVAAELAELHRGGGLAGSAHLALGSASAAGAAVTGAAAAGARACVACAEDDLPDLAAAAYDAAALGLPIVLSGADPTPGPARGRGRPMTLRDAGCVQLHASSVQEAVDLHLQAFAVARRASTPVLVCTGGLPLGAVTEAVVPPQEEIDAFLPAAPGPEAAPATVRQRLATALHVVPEVAYDFHRRFGRRAGGLVSAHRTQGADTVLLTVGTTAGAAREVVDRRRERGVPAGSLAVTCVRPWPADAVRAAVAGARRVVVVEPAGGGVLGPEVRDTIGAHPAPIEVVEAVADGSVRGDELLALVEDVGAHRVRSGRLHVLGDGARTAVAPG